MIIEDRYQNPYRPEQLVSKRLAFMNIVLEEEEEEEEENE